MKIHKNEKLLVAHRGVHLTEPENTLAAFEAAIKAGADMIEFDVRRTGDGKLIIYHNDSIAEKKLSDLSHAEVKTILSKRGIMVATFEDSLKLMSGRILADIEMKEAGYEKSLVELTLRYLNPSEFFISSFNYKSVLNIKSTFPDVQTGLLLGQRNPAKRLRTRIQEMFPFFFARRPDVLLPHWKICNIWNILYRHLFRKEVIVWTVNNEKMLRKYLHKIKVRGVITDDIALAKRISGRK